jgi:Tol biopolymer transport system component
MKFNIGKFLTWFSVICAAGVIATFNASAQRVTVSGTLVAGGNVSRGFEISPDSRYAVFIADKDTDGKAELYSVRLSTRAITKISGNIGPNADVQAFKISPDSTRVVFAGALQQAGVQELYSAPIATADSRVTLSGAVVSGGNVTLDFQISPDSTRVVFSGNLVTSARTELFSAPIATADSRVTISGATVTGTTVADDFRISPDSTRVVFRGDFETTSRNELFSAPIAAADSRVKLSGTAVTAGDVEQFQISPDGARVVFIGDLQTDGIVELFSAPIATANSRITLSGTAVSGRNVINFGISPNSARVVFIGNLLADDARALFSAPIATADSRVTLAGPFSNGGDLTLGFTISPDSTRVVFRGNIVALDIVELFSAPIATANSRIKISGTSVGDVVGSPRISPDGTRVVFRGDLATVGKIELYSAPIATADRRVAISGDVVSSSSVADFEISPDGARVVFTGIVATPGVTDLFSAPIATANQRITLTGARLVGGDVENFQITPDGARVVFRGDLTTDEEFELYRIQIGGSALSLDFDGDDRVLANTDVLMLARYQLGIRGTALTANALSANAGITLPLLIESKIRAALEQAPP